MEFQKISVPSPPQHTEDNENSEGRGLESTETEVNINQLLDEVFVISGTMWSSRKYPYPPPPPALTHGGQRKFRGKGGGRRVRVFFGGLRVRLMSKQTVIFLLIGVPKQKLMFSSMIFYWRSAECLFHGLYDSLCNPIVVGL